MAKHDFYDVLGVTRTADDETIKKAYRKAAMRYHPDRCPGDTEAEEKFKEASEAYEVLSDPQRRQTYDRFGHEGLNQQGFSGFRSTDDIFSAFGSIFDDLFGFGGQRGGGRHTRGQDLGVELTITLEDVLNGGTRALDVNYHEVCGACGGNRCEAGHEPEICRACGGRGQVVRAQGFFSVSTTCPGCRGAGRIITHLCRRCSGRGVEEIPRTVSVTIPPGVDNGTRLRLGGLGDPGPAGGAPGDLYVLLRVEPHPAFEREGDVLFCHAPITFTQAALGATIEIPTLEDEPATVKIPPGTQTHTLFTLRGRGLPRLRGRGRGHMVVRVVVEVPKRVTKEQRRLLQQLDGELAKAAGRLDILERIKQLRKTLGQ